MAEGQKKPGKVKKACSTFSVFFLVSVNFLIGLGGILLVAFGSYAFANFQEFEDLISQKAIVATVIAGLILFILSMVAILGALNKWKTFLSIYVFLLLAIVVGEVIVVFVTLEYLGVIEGASDAADAENGNSEDLLNSREIIINDFLLRIYDTCCFSNEEFCTTDDTSEDFCNNVLPCQDGVDGICVSAEQVEDLDQSVCTAIEKLGGSVGAILNPPSQGGCGGGDPAVFLDVVAEVFTDRIKSIEIALGVIGGLEFLMILFTMYIIFAKKVDYNKRMPWDDDAEVEVAETVSEEELQRLSVRSNQPVRFNASPPTSAPVRTMNLNSDDTPPPPMPQAALPAPPSVASLPSRASAKTNRTSITRRQLQEDPTLIDDVL